MNEGRVSGTLLLVNPSCDLHQDIIRDVEQTGLTVIATSDPSEAVLLCERQAPDVVITDLSLCGEAGLTLIQALRRHGRTCPVIVVSEEPSGGMVAKAFQAGATECLQKPIVKEEFTRVLDRIGRWAGGTAVPVSGLLRFDQRFVLTCDLTSVEETVLWMIEATAMMVPDAVRMGLRGALQELLVNAVEHGNLEISSDEKKQAVANGRYEALVLERSAQPAFKERCVIVEVSCDTKARRLTYCIIDQGKGFDWRAMLERKPEGVGLMDGSGRGLLLVRSLFPDLSYNERGNEVMFTVPLG
ncbi:MAG: response regulator [Nitrospira sp.]|nr:response regulator [Nitrospira sp.]MCP9443568.1 response regulator [Nitrospira sp.]